MRCYEHLPLEADHMMSDGSVKDDQVIPWFAFPLRLQVDAIEIEEFGPFDTIYKKGEVGRSGCSDWAQAFHVNRINYRG